MNDRRSRTAFIEQMARVPWREFPGHFGGALSKMLVGPERGGSARMDFRVSRYAPNAYVEEHAHKVQEQAYYVIDFSWAAIRDIQVGMFGGRELGTAFYGSGKRYNPDLW